MFALQQKCNMLAQRICYSYARQELLPATIRPHSRRVVARATAGGDDQPKPDIDQLAAFLTQKAVEMRASMDDQDLPLLSEVNIDSTADAGADANADKAAAAADAMRAMASADEAVTTGAAVSGEATPMDTVELLNAIGDDVGFISQDFTIVKILGRVGMQDVASTPTSGSATPGRVQPQLETPNIIVYAARYSSGLPYQGPVTVQLREYLPNSRNVAKNELLVQQRLCGELPVEKWQAAVQEPDKSCPVVPLLGFLQAPPSDEAFALSDDPADTLWLVYKFEGMRPMSLMLQQIDLPEEPSGLQSMFMKREEVIAAALQARHTLLRSIAQGLLQALSFCHQRGVAHCGLGPGSVVINTWKDKEVERLLVKLDNFGLARIYPHPLELTVDSSSIGGLSTVSVDDTDAMLQRQQDLQAAGLLLAEVFMVGAAAAGAEILDVPALKRLLFDVFHEDISLFKEYCEQDDENFGGFVEFMDEKDGAGWELLESLLHGKVAAGELLRAARFFAQVSSDVSVE